MSLAFLVCLGCAGEGDKEYLDARVSGVVTLDGSPVPGATVTFIPTSGEETSGFAQTNDEGKFELNSSPTTVGVAPGSYKVTVKKVEFPKGDSPGPEDPGYRGAGQTAQPTYIVPKKYSQLSTTDLEVTVTEGDNEVPLELTP